MRSRIGRQAGTQLAAASFEDANLAEVGGSARMHVGHEEQRRLRARPEHQTLGLFLFRFATPQPFDIHAGVAIDSADKTVRTRLDDADAEVLLRRRPDSRSPTCAGR